MNLTSLELNLDLDLNRHMSLDDLMFTGAEDDGLVVPFDDEQHRQSPQQFAVQSPSQTQNQSSQLQHQHERHNSEMPRRPDDLSISSPLVLHQNQTHHHLYRPLSVDFSQAGDEPFNSSPLISDFSVFHGADAGWDPSIFETSPPEGVINVDPDLDLDLDLSTRDVNFPVLDDNTQQLPLQQHQDPEQQQQPEVPVDNTTMATIEEFFLKNGASRPDAPCNYCRRRRLQCLILNTTDANPNPTRSCSSCVALFRECSLSGRQKRDPSAFETSRPVIGGLHGVSEHPSPLDMDESGSTQLPQQTTDSSTVAALSKKRANTRSVRKTRTLRNWFSSHIDHPYPSEDEKTALAEQSGLTRSQVINWFANTRRRQRLSSGSLISPRGSRSNLSPLERWHNSPPDDEPASVSAIREAIAGTIGHPDEGPAWDGNNSSSSDSLMYPNPPGDLESSASVSSRHSSVGRSLFSNSAQSSFGEMSASLPRSTSSRTRRSKLVAFQCTFCRQSFKKKYDWVRHERSIHLPGLDSWVCAAPVTPEQSFLVWRVNHNSPECLFCGQDAPTEEHVQTHEFDTCAERPVAERKFTRKDHLWQHLQKFHGCRKWDGWKPDLGLLQHRHDKVRSKCGFCQLVLESWEERMEHLALHFRSGMTLKDWVGDVGIEQHDAAN